MICIRNGQLGVRRANRSEARHVRTGNLIFALIAGFQSFFSCSVIDPRQLDSKEVKEEQSKYVGEKPPVPEWVRRYPNISQVSGYLVGYAKVADTDEEARILAENKAFQDLVGQLTVTVHSDYKSNVNWLRVDGSEYSKEEILNTIRISSSVENLVGHTTEVYVTMSGENAGTYARCMLSADIWDVQSLYRIRTIRVNSSISDTEFLKAVEAVTEVFESFIDSEGMSAARQSIDGLPVSLVVLPMPKNNDRILKNLNIIQNMFGNEVQIEMDLVEGLPSLSRPVIVIKETIPISVRDKLPEVIKMLNETKDRSIEPATIKRLLQILWDDDSFDPLFDETVALSVLGTLLGSGRITSRAKAGDSRDPSIVSIADNINRQLETISRRFSQSAARYGVTSARADYGTPPFDVVLHINMRSTVDARFSLSFSDGTVAQMKDLSIPEQEEDTEKVALQAIIDTGKWLAENRVFYLHSIQPR